MELWVGCIAGALEEKEYERLLREAGFTDISIEPTRVYEFTDAGIDDVLARENQWPSHGGVHPREQAGLALRSQL